MEDVKKFNKEIEELRELKINIHELRKSYDQIINQEIKDYLKKIIILSDKIYKEILVNTQKIDRIRNFNSYYIITVQKILKQYIRLNENRIKSEESKQLYTKIENFIPKVSEGFEKIYNSLFEDDFVDIDAEIKVMMNEIKIKE